VTQKFYFHDATSSDTGTLPSSVLLTGHSLDTTAATAATNRTMDGTIGSSQVTISLSATGGFNANWFRRFISAPLAAGSVSAANWTYSIAGKATTTGNSFMVGLFQWRPSTGIKIATIIAFQSAGTLTTSEANFSTAISGASFTLVVGDILVVEIYESDNTTSTDSFFYDGTTEGSITSNAGFLNAPVDIPLVGAAPNPPLRRYPNPWELLPL
jgi:hypothetical protein